MTFLHPLLFAFGVAAISIPIIIHLLMHRRRKPVMWGAMRFLLEAYKRQRRRLMVEKWLLLATRCLLLLLIALALGRPLLEKFAGLGASRTVFILLDNSVASTAKDAAGEAALARHQAVARALIDALSANASSSADRVAIIALGGPSEALISPPSANLASVRSLVDAIEPTDSRADFPGGLALATKFIGSGGDAQSGASRPDQSIIVLLSDFLEGAADLSTAGDALSSIKFPAGVRVVASEPSAIALSNTSIVNVQPLRSVLIDSPRASTDASSDLVRVELARSGASVSQAQSTSVRLRLASAAPSTADRSSDLGEQRAVVRFAPGQETGVAVIPIKPDRKLLGGGSGSSNADANPLAGSGARTLRDGAVLVAQIDDDAIDADNRFRRPVEIRETLRVGIVAPIRFGKAERVDKLDAGSWARIALTPGPDGSAIGIDVVTIEPASLDQSRLLSLDAVILPRPDLIAESSWSRLKLFAENGGLILLCPPPEISVHVWGDALSRGLGTPWMPAREAIATPNATIRRPAASIGAEGADRTGLLALIEGELDELLRAVNVSKVLPLDPRPDSGSVLLELDNSAPLLWFGELGKNSASDASGNPITSSSRGTIIYLGVALDLDYSDLPAKPLMVPLLQELIRQGIGQARGTWSSRAGLRPNVPSRTQELRELPDPAFAGSAVSQDRPAVSASENNVIKLGSNAAGSLAETDSVRRAGLYRAIDDRGVSRGIVGINADPRGCRAGIQTRENVSVWLRQSLTDTTIAAGTDPIQWLPSGSTAGSGSSTTDLASSISGVLGKVAPSRGIAFQLLIAALVLAIFEIFIARRASHAEADAALSTATQGSAA